MNQNTQILSNITIFSKYARHLPHLDRRETWDEICNRYQEMMTKKYPALATQITSRMQLVRTKKILPSMRAMQFAGPAIERNESRLYNCAYLPIDDYRSFPEAMFLLLGGTGVGYSVQKHHVEQLPCISHPTKERKFLVADSIEGWADAIKALMKAYFGLSTTKPVFDLGDIRPKGMALITAGGKAPGPEPLRICLTKIESILREKPPGSQLTPIEVHDILCHIANAVLAGGIRRAAMISLFSFDDEDMKTCKFGNWWELNEQRGRANNSAVILRHKIKEEEFYEFMDKVEASNAGEPGVYFSNDKEYGTNPCCFTGDMRVLTPHGYIKFESLAKETEFQFINKNGETVPGSVWSTGVKPTVTLTLYGNQRITCTSDHRFMDIEGNELEAKDTVGKRLMPYFSLNKSISEYTKLGFIQGDGATGRLKSDSHKGLEIYFGEKDDDVAEVFEVAPGRQYVNGYNDILKDLGFSSEELPKRELPTKYSRFTSTEKLDFLKGLYSANGCVITTSRVAFKTTCRKLAEQLVVTILNLSEHKAIPYITTNKSKEVEFSNGNYTCKESYDVNIGTLQGIKWFAENINFIQTYKQEALANMIITRAPKVLSIQESGEQEVFDFNLQDDTHWGVVEGVVAHNCEIALRPYQFCNLVEVSAHDVKDQADFEVRIATATFFGTLQAGFTDFHYLRDVWKRTTEKDALIGVGLTGIASGSILDLDISKGAQVAKNVNAEVAKLIGINEAARVTTVKPAGTTSCVLGTSSGIHAWHNDYYIRRIRIGKNEALYTYLAIHNPEMIEDDYFRPETQAIISVPQMAPEGAILRTEPAADLLERVKRFNLDWVRLGHRKGQNTNNVSATISVKTEEWPIVKKWMWENKDTFNGISVLPYDNGSYIQAPFTDCTKEEYETLSTNLHSIDLTQVIEIADNTDLQGELACAGGGCEIK